MDSLILYLLSGFTIGTTMALIPSPLLTLLISETMAHGRKEGIKIALIPSVTDFFFITLSIAAMSALKNIMPMLIVISMAGAFYLTRLAVKTWQNTGLTVSRNKIKPQSIRKGIITNIFNPSAYIFWFTIGAPIIINQWSENHLFPVFYLLGFYICLLGVRIAVAFLVARFNSILSTRGYVYMTRFLSIVLFLFALKIIHDGIIMAGKFIS